VEDPDGVKRPQNKKNQRDKKSDDDTTPKSGKKPNISDEIKTHRSADDAEAKKAAADKAAEEADRQARDDARRAQRDAAANRAKSMAAIQQALNGASGSMAGKFSSDTEITMPGPGRAAFVKYFEYLHALYLQSWKQPAAISKSEAYVMAEIIVLRDGTLKDFRITKPSGIREFDESVREVLRSHRKLMPLPSDSTDPERAFSIRFTIDSNANSST
jgi:TonB family protein